MRLGDVAQVERASTERRSYYRSNGQSNLGLGVIKTSTANALDVARAVRGEAGRIQAALLRVATGLPAAGSSWRWPQGNCTAPMRARMVAVRELT